jgi:hypothetical protein
MSKASVARSAAPTNQTVPLSDITISWEYDKHPVSINGAALARVLAWLNLEFKHYGDALDERTYSSTPPDAVIDLSPRVLEGFHAPTPIVLRGLSQALTQLSENCHAEETDDAVWAIGMTLRDLTARIEAADDYFKRRMASATVTVREPAQAVA